MKDRRKSKNQPEKFNEEDALSLLYIFLNRKNEKQI